MSFHMHQNSYNQINGKLQCGKNEKKLEPSYSTGETVKWGYPLWKTILWLLNKPNMNYQATQEIQPWEYAQESMGQAYRY